MTAAAFPHAYPFRFVDTVLQRPDGDFEGGRVRVRVTGNARSAMGESWQTGLLYPEVIAQAALLLQGGDPEAGRHGYLAGITELSIERAPRAGETLEISVRRRGQFGAMLRFDGEVRAVGGEAGAEELVARGSVLVRRGEAAAEATS
jgi:3-hydroxymyristoyl/3-hydroxydecanoyl-(acyl carrier protein) dehydratase